MNIRIDRDLKIAGDKAFSDLGYTPTEVVRKVWDFARRNLHDRAALDGLMDALRDPSEIADEDEAAARRLAEFDDWLAQGQDTMRTCFAQAGMAGGPPALSAAEYDELVGVGLDDETR